MLDFIAKYWIEFVFSGIAGLAVWFFKDWYSLVRDRSLREERKRIEKVTQGLKEDSDAFRAESEEGDIELRAEVEQVKSDVRSLKEGILSIQGKQFRADCRKLLSKEHEITLDEWEEISDEHRIYNNLGGNHRGDELFGLVKEKFQTSIGAKQ